PKPQNPKTPKPLCCRGRVQTPAKTPCTNTHHQHNHNTKNHIMEVKMDVPKYCNLVSDLANFASFVVNIRTAPMTVKSELTPAGVSALASLLAFGAEIDYLALYEELPEGAAAELGVAIKHSGRISELSLGRGNRKSPDLAQELLHLVAVSATPALEQLSIEWIRIDDGRMKEIGNSFGKLTALRSLTISHCAFAIPLLARQISKLRALESLTISKIFNIIYGVGTLFAALKDLPLLTDMSFSEYNTNAESWRHIGDFVASGRIRKLHLNYAALKDEGISMIVDVVLASGRQMCKLSELCLIGNSIGPAGARKISELVARSPHLRCLDLRLNPMGMIAIDARKKSANSLQELNMNQCELGPQESLLFISLSAFRALTVLKISHNKVGNAGAVAISHFLLVSGGRTLAELEMNLNHITEAGAFDLAKGLAISYALRSIDIAQNQLGPRGAVAIIDALNTASMVPMNKIEFALCKLRDPGAEAVGKLIMHRGCKRVLLDWCEIQTEGAKAIADSVDASACVIEVLNLYNNFLGDEGVKCILDKIMLRNRSVYKLYINVSDIVVEGAMAFKRAMEAQGALKELVCLGVASDAKARGIMDETERAGLCSKSDRWTPQILWQKL
ncbi:MAG: hypothetical protein P4L50_08940, partial [Anaerolineaceae bacterium]|nr:hypothetical protein [Anaerolineaceae bacterium]